MTCNSQQLLLVRIARILEILWFVNQSSPNNPTSTDQIFYSVHLISYGIELNYCHFNILNVKILESACEILTMVCF